MTQSFIHAGQTNHDPANLVRSRARYHSSYRNPHYLVKSIAIKLGTQRIVRREVSTETRSAANKAPALRLPPPRPPSSPPWALTCSAELSLHGGYPSGGLPLVRHWDWAGAGSDPSPLRSQRHGDYTFHHSGKKGVILCDFYEPDGMAVNFHSFCSATYHVYRFVTSCVPYQLTPRH